MTIHCSLAAAAERCRQAGSALAAPRPSPSERLLPPSLSCKQVSKTISQMVMFIRQEAEEKAAEIGVSAEEEFNITKLQVGGLRSIGFDLGFGLEVRLGWTRLRGDGGSGSSQGALPGSTAAVHCQGACTSLPSRLRALPAARQN